MGTCKGDSGGPAITRRFYDGSFHYTVLGVVSGNPRPLNCGILPDFYTYVGHEKVSENSSSNSHFCEAQARVRQGRARDGQGWPLRRKALKLKTLA